MFGNYGGKGHGSTADTSLAERRILCADVDRLEALWQEFAPSIELEIGSTSISLEPRDIDDFHPDHLFDTLPVFARLRETRKALLDPSTAQETLDQLLASQPSGAEAPPEQPDQQEAESKEENAGGMLERLLGKPASSSFEPRPPTGGPDIEQFIRDLVAPHIVASPDPRVDTAIESVDLAISELMRQVLHHPEFQGLEASWRSLYGMLESVEVDEELQLFVCDVSRPDLLDGLPEPETGLDQSGLFDLLVNRQRAADDEPWTLLVGDHYFGGEPEDIAVLTALGAAAAVNGGVFLAGARPDMLGCKDARDLAEPRNWTPPATDSLWHSLRNSDFAAHIGLALPRVLARTPYGQSADPTERFEFEELSGRHHEAFLWANPAYSLARLLAEGFKHHGWDMEPGAHVDLGPLPAYTFEHDGERRLQPCGEVLIPESAMVALLDQGLMPIVSYRDRNTAVVGRFQSIAAPPAALDGPWAK